MIFTDKSKNPAKNPLAAKTAKKATPKKKLKKEPTKSEPKKPEKETTETELKQSEKEPTRLQPLAEKHEPKPALETKTEPETKDVAKLEETPPKPDEVYHNVPSFLFCNYSISLKTNGHLSPDKWHVCIPLFYLWYICFTENNSARA